MISIHLINIPVYPYYILLVTSSILLTQTFETHFKLYSLYINFHKVSTT